MITHRLSRRLLLLLLAAGLLTGCARRPNLLGFEDDAAVQALLQEAEEALPQLEQAATEGLAAKQALAGAEPAEGEDPNAAIDPAYGQAVDLRGRLAPLAYSAMGGDPRVSGVWDRVRAAERSLLAAGKLKPASAALTNPAGVGQYFLAYRVFAPLQGWQFWLALLVTTLAFFALLYVLQQLGSAARRRLTVVCTFVAGLFYLVAFFVPQTINPVKNYETPLGNFLLVVGGFTVGLGVINLCLAHGRTLVRARPGWINSAGFFAGFLGMAIFGIWSIYVTPEEGAATVPLATAGYQLLFEGLLTPLQSTTFALLGFYIVTAAYRAFRIRTVEAGLMTVIAFLVMLGQVPLGQAITAHLSETGPWASLRLENVSNWLLTIPNTAATRGILFGSVTGSFALSLRVWLSLERGSYFGKEF